MPAPQISRDEVLVRLTRAFRKTGYEGTSLADLSRETGLVKASLYHYFPNGKQDMARAVIEHLGNRLAKEVLSKLEGEGTPEQLLQDMAAGIADFYENGSASCIIDLFSTGAAKQFFNRELVQALSMWRDAVVKVLVRAGQSEMLARRRALRGLMLIQGALILSRTMDDRFLFISAVGDLPNVFLEGMTGEAG